jgi:hypothetical protein
LEEAIHRKLMETRTALEWLVKEGFLIEITQAPIGRLFRLNPERRSQAELLLERCGEEAPDGEGTPDKVGKS